MQECQEEKPTSDDEKLSSSKPKKKKKTIKGNRISDEVMLMLFILSTFILGTVREL